jgi:hypothetical protein
MRVSGRFPSRHPLPPATYRFDRRRITRYGHLGESLPSRPKGGTVVEGARRQRESLFPLQGGVRRQLSWADMHALTKEGWLGASGHGRLGLRQRVGGGGAWSESAHQVGWEGERRVWIYRAKLVGCEVGDKRKKGQEAGPHLGLSLGIRPMHPWEYVTQSNHAKRATNICVLLVCPSKRERRIGERES